MKQRKVRITETKWIGGVLVHLYKPDYPYLSFTQASALVKKFTEENYRSVKTFRIYENCFIIYKSLLPSEAPKRKKIVPDNLAHRTPLYYQIAKKAGINSAALNVCLKKSAVNSATD